jgi:flagellar P-ring protein precursor FlgI
MPGTVRPGDRVSVQVSSVGDAKSLAGGVLLQSNLRAANGNVYAVAQGVVATSSRTTANETVGTVPGGAIVEREVGASPADEGSIALVLRNPDFQTAAAIAEAVASAVPEVVATAVDSSLVQLSIPTPRDGGIVGLIAGIEQLPVVPDTAARVVVNPRSGIVVVGKHVTIGEVAVSYRDMTVTIGQSSRRSRSNEPQNPVHIADMTTVDDLVSVLQELGVDSDTVIEILKAIDAAGALHGRLIVM